MHIVNDDDVGVEVVMMDTVRGAIRASGGIWVEGENSRQETEEFLQKNWSRWKIGLDVRGQVLDRRILYSAFDETIEGENTQY